MAESRGVAPRPKAPRHPSPQAKPGPKPGSSPENTRSRPVNKPYADEEIYVPIDRKDFKRLLETLASGDVRLQGLYNTRAYIRMTFATKNGDLAIEFWPDDE